MAPTGLLFSYMPSNLKNLPTPRLFLRKTSDVTPGASGILTRLTWGTASTSEVTPTVDLTYSTGTTQSGTSGHIVVNTTGTYFISGTVAFLSVSDETYRWAQVVVCNSSDVAITTYNCFLSTSVNGAVTDVAFSTLQSLNRDDRVKILFAHNSASSPTVLGSVSGSGTRTFVQMAMVDKG